MVRSGGFTLVEVLVALVVLEVGLLGVVGSLTLSARLLTRAETLERGAILIERVYDSLVAAEAPAGSGSTIDGRWRVDWVVASDGWARLTFGAGEILPVVTLEARVSAPRIGR